MWMTLVTGIDRVAQLGLLIVLARFLSPHSFGLIGLGLLSLAVLQKGLRFGVDAALIQHESDDIDEYLDTALWLGLARGTLIAGAAYLLAPVAATAFDSGGLTDVIRILALSPLLTGMANPGAVYFRKDLAFDKQFVYRSSGTAAYVCVALGAVLVAANVWALVAGIVARSAARSVVSYVIHPYRPGFGFDGAAARELLEFGKWIFGSGLVLLVLNWGDDAVVGLLLGASSVGLYQLAFRLSNAPATEVSQVVSTVTFPAFSKLQDDPDRLRETYLRTLRVLAYVSLPVAVGIAAVADAFVRAFFGPEWFPMIDALRVLAVWGAMRSIVATIGPLFRAIGRPAYNTALQSLRMIVFLAVLLPATAAWGITGTAVALVVSAAVENPVAVVVVGRTLDARLSRFPRSLAVPLGASLSMGAVVVAVDRIGVVPSGPTGVAVLVTIGVAWYASVLGAVYRTSGLDVLEDVAQVRAGLE
nr:lipopolysaccharide biosynthesis protein [Halorientalis sp. IM1011]